MNRVEAAAYGDAWSPSRSISPIFGSFGRQDAVVVGRTDRETLKGEPESDEVPVALRPGERASQGWLARPASFAKDSVAQQVADTTSKRLEGVRPASASRLASAAGNR